MTSGFLSINDVFLIITVSLMFLLAALLRLLPERDSAFRDSASLFFVAWGCALLATLFVWNPFLQSSPLGSSVLIPLVLVGSTLLQGSFFASLIYWVEKKAQFSFVSWVAHFLPSILVAVIVVFYAINAREWMPSQWGLLGVQKSLAVQLAWIVTCSVPIGYGVWALVFLALRLKSGGASATATETGTGVAPYSPRYTLLFALAYAFVSLWSFIGFWLGFGLDYRINTVLGEWGIYLQFGLAVTMLLLGCKTLRQWMRMDVAEVVSPEQIKDEINKVDERVLVIEQAITVQKVYLDAHLNLERFSEKIGMKSRDVSILLNSHYKMNFFEFINRHRVEEAKRLLIESQSSTVIDVIYKSGFNSQSAFHRFFKRFAGATPSEYRQLHLSSGQASSDTMLKAS